MPHIHVLRHVCDACMWYMYVMPHIHASYVHASYVYEVRHHIHEASHTCITYMHHKHALTHVYEASQTCLNTGVTYMYHIRGMYMRHHKHASQTCLNTCITYMHDIYMYIHTPHTSSRSRCVGDYSQKTWEVDGGCFIHTHMLVLVYLYIYIYIYTCTYVHVYTHKQ